jgi:CheY-like chemotaxis protein
MPHQIGAFFYCRHRYSGRTNAEWRFIKENLQWHRSCFFTFAVADILFCTSNPILAKSLYGILRDEGYSVETADHPAMAVRMALLNRYAAVIMDPEPFGLSVEDAVGIIKTIQPGILVIFVGCDNLGTDVLSVEMPIDLEDFRGAIRQIRPAVTVPVASRAGSA